MTRMDFSGWEKLSLVDFDDCLTTTLFAAGCNFRCPFCHNGGLVLTNSRPAAIPWETIYGYAKKRAKELDAVCVSGGEPTLMPDLPEKLLQIKKLGYKVKLDTNGTNPDVLSSLIEKGLVDHVAMDIKNSKEKYPLTVGLPSLDMSKIEASISLLIHSGISYEFRTTLIQEFHSREDIEKISFWLSGAKKYYLQMFIDSPSCICHGLHAVTKENAEEYKNILAKTMDMVELRGYE